MDVVEQGRIPEAPPSWLREELLSQVRLRGGSSESGDRSGGSSFSLRRRDCFLFKELLHTQAQTFSLMVLSITCLLYM